MDFFDYLGKLKASSLDLAGLSIDNDSPNMWDNGFVVSMKDFETCKELGKDSFDFSISSDNVPGMANIGFTVDGVGLFNSSQKGRESELRGTFSPDAERIVVTPWAEGYGHMGEFNVHGLEHLYLRSYGKPVVFEGENRNDEFLFYFYRAHEHPSVVRDEIRYGILEEPFIVPEKYMDTLIETKESEGKDFLELAPKALYLDERRPNWGVRVEKMEKDGNGDYVCWPVTHGNFGTAFGLSQLNAFRHWLKDPMREVELKAGKKAMDDMQKSLFVVEVKENTVTIDFDKMNRDADNRKNGFSFSKDEILEGWRNHNAKSLFNVARETGDIGKNINVYLTFKEQDNDWSIKVPAKSVFLKSYRASDNENLKRVNHFSLTVSDREDVKVMFSNKMERNSVFTAKFKSDEFFRLAEQDNRTKAYRYMHLPDEKDFKNLFVRKTMNEMFEKKKKPIAFVIPKEKRKGVLHGRSGDNLFIVFKNLGKNFSARLNCTAMEIDDRQNLKVSVMPFQEVRIPLKNKESLEVTVVNKDDMEKLLDANLEVGKRIEGKAVDRTATKKRKKEVSLQL